MALHWSCTSTLFFSPPNVRLRSSALDLNAEYGIDPFWNDTDGIQCWLWRRQARKSTQAANKALRRMMEIPGLSSFFVSASVALGAEFVRKESEMWTRVLTEMKLRAKASGQELHTYSTEKGKAVEFNHTDIDALSEIFEAQKLETRIYHNRTTYSRSRVIAPNPATAVGWTGDIWMDEVGRMPEFKAVLEAVLPFMSSNPQYLLLMITTPPPEDDHYSWEMLAPQAGQEFSPNPRGNYFISQAGFRVHRVDAWDAAAAGVSLFDDFTRKPVSPEEHRAKAYDKQAWDRNFALKFIMGGQTAVSLNDINRAMAGPLCGVALDITERLVAIPS